MRIFLTGASGYIGGSVAAALKAAGHDVVGLVRSTEKANAVRAHGIDPLVGSLDDKDILTNAARAADAVVHAADAEHRASAISLIDALAGSGKPLLHTSGSSIVGTPAGGHRVDDVFDEDTPFTPSPARASRVALNETVLASATRGLRPVIVCPALIYGEGRGLKPDSMQVPWLIETAKRHGVAKHLGPGENIWSVVHIDDLVDLYMRALDQAPAGAFYYAENGEYSMREICSAIHRMMGIEGPSTPMTLDEAAQEWGAGPAENTMGSNSRVRAKRARTELGWTPRGRGLIEEIEQGCYREAA